MSGQIALPALDNTMGALFIGVLISASLWGMGALQTYEYFHMYKGKDTWHIKLIVGTVSLFDTVHQALIMHLVYTYLVTNYGNPLELTEVVWSLVVQVLFSALIATLVQSFFVWRIWRLSHKNWFMTAGLMTLVLSEFAVSFAYFVKGFSTKTFAELQTLTHISRAVNSLTVGGDVMITLTLIYLLQSSKTGFSGSNSLVNKLIIYSLNTGLLTSFDAVMSLVFITVFPNTLLYAAFYATLARLYTNSLLATLNSRQSVRQSSAISMANISAERSYRPTHGHLHQVDIEKGNKHGENPLSIQVETQTIRAYDEVGSPSDRKLGDMPSKGSPYINEDEESF